MINRIRVLHIVSGIAIGEYSGGAEFYAIRILKCLNQDQFEPHIYSMNRYGSESELEWQEFLKTNNINLHFGADIDGQRNLSFHQILRNLFSTISELNPTILHSHSERGDLLNTLIHWFHPIHPKSIRTVHLEKSWVSKPYLKLLFESILFPITFSVETAVSSTIMHNLNQRWGTIIRRKKALLTYNGLDSKYFALRSNDCNSTKSDSEWKSKIPKIVVIGRLTEQKGHKYLFYAMPKILESLSVELAIIGSGDLENELMELADELEITQFVHFLGYRDNIIELLSEFDLLVSSSLWEGLPTVILEGISQFIPIVATDVSGTREIILPNYSGILVPSADPNLLAEAIIWMLKNPAEANRMAQNAFNLASKYTIENTANTISNLYQSVITYNP